MKGLLCVALAALLLGSAPAGFKPTIINWNLTPQTIHTSCVAEIARAKAAAKAIAAAKGPRTFRNTILAFEDVNANLNDRLVAQTFLSQIAPDAAVRKSSLECSNLVGAFGAEVGADPELYRAMRAAQRSGTATSVYDRRLTELTLEGFERSGAALPPSKRARFVQLSKELTRVQNAYAENYANDKTTITISKAEAEGLPSDFIGTLKATGDGYIVPVNGSTNPQFLGNARGEEARKRFYIAYGSIQAKANVALLQRQLALRSQLASLLGYSSWAAYQLAPRVDKSPAHIVGFLKNLDAHVLPGARADIARLASLKAADLGTQTAPIELWDVPYYLNQLLKTTYALDQQEVRQYFPAPHVVDAVTSIYQHILGVRFSPVQPANAYYKDVTEFAVTDAATGRFIGTFLLDLFPREGKPGGAYNAPILPVRRLGGTYRAPVSVMQVSDWPASVNDKPALLTHDDVVTFFHEFGHVMASMLATAPYETLNQFQQDFVEAPSQMLENFVWDPVILKKISANVDTGAPLPDALITKMRQARCLSDRLCNAYAATRQLLYSVVDMDYHMSGPHVDTTQVWARDAAALTPLPMVPGTHPEAQFTHFASGYDAGYYTYLWALVYAQDMFTAFQKGGLESATVGMRYRKTILEPARTLDPDVEVQHFLGRPMSPAAFYAGFKNAGY